MSYRAIRNCEWCGVEHEHRNHEIQGHDGNHVRALRTRSDIILDKVITFNSMLVAAGIGALIHCVVF